MILRIRPFLHNDQWWFDIDYCLTTVSMSTASILYDLVIRLVVPIFRVSTITIVKLLAVGPCGSLVPRPSLSLASAVTILEAGKKELVKREEGLIKLVT